MLRRREQAGGQLLVVESRLDDQHGNGPQLEAELERGYRGQRELRAEARMDEADDPAVPLADDQAGGLERDHAEGMSIQLVDPQRPGRGGGWNRLVPESDQGRGIGVAERAEARHRSVWVAAVDVDGGADGSPLERSGRRTDVHPNGVDRPPGSRDGDQHIVTLDLHLVNGLLDLRTQGGLAGPNLELPAMPGAGDRGPFDGPLSQRSPLMWADPVDCRDH